MSKNCPKIAQSPCNDRILTFWQFCLFGQCFYLLTLLVPKTKMHISFWLERNLQHSHFHSRASKSTSCCPCFSLLRYCSLFLSSHLLCLASYVLLPSLCRQVPPGVAHKSSSKAAERVRMPQPWYPPWARKLAKIIFFLGCALSSLCTHTMGLNWEVLNGVGVDGVGVSSPFSYASSLFFFAFLRFSLRFSLLLLKGKGKQ